MGCVVMPRVAFCTCVAFLTRAGGRLKSIPKFLNTEPKLRSFWKFVLDFAFFASQTRKKNIGGAHRVAYDTALLLGGLSPDFSFHGFSDFGHVGFSMANTMIWHERQPAYPSFFLCNHCELHHKSGFVGKSYIGCRKFMGSSTKT